MKWLGVHLPCAACEQDLPQKSSSILPSERKRLLPHCGFLHFSCCETEPATRNGPGGNVLLYICMFIYILECTRAGALGNKPNEALL